MLKNYKKSSPEDFGESMSGTKEQTKIHKEYKSREGSLVYGATFP